MFGQDCEVPRKWYASCLTQECGDNDTWTKMWTITKGGQDHALGHRDRGNLCRGDISHSPGVVAGIMSPHGLHLRSVQNKSSTDCSHRFLRLAYSSPLRLARSRPLGTIVVHDNGGPDTRQPHVVRTAVHAVDRALPKQRFIK